MEFIDLFAGLGGFHLALRRLGHRCVFASEIDPGLRYLYKENFGLTPVGDIKSVDVTQVPRHDILCAGFPCQPFSKAGDQQGLDCPKWGDLFKYVLKIVRCHRPQYLMLENVPNLERHDQGRTWQAMKAALEADHYRILNARLSPHRFGIPQIRDRLFIVGSRSDLSSFSWPDEATSPPPSILSVLDENPTEARKLPDQLLRCLDVWQDFLAQFPKDQDLPSFPVWSMEFGATYPFEHWTPHSLGWDNLGQYRGSHGHPLSVVPPEQAAQFLPSHARTAEARFPSWKSHFIRQNRNLYRAHRQWIDAWMPNVRQFPPSLQKLEWNCKGGERDIWKYVIQIRASGVRVKRPTTAPSLIAMTTTQVPIIAWEKRYMTPRECARLQSMLELKALPAASTRAYAALGNAVNVQLVEMVARRLLRS